MAFDMDAVLFGPITDSTDVFVLKGGDYAVSAIGTSDDNTISLVYRGPDGETYLAVGDSTTFAADAVAVVSLAPGQYKFLVAGTITAGYAQAVRIPRD